MNNFNEHIAKVELENEDFFILNWQNKNSSTEYQVHYILDKKQGILYISGDLGSCVTYWRNRLTPEALVGMLGNVGRFLSMCECSSDNYIRTDEAINADVEQLKLTAKERLVEKYEDDPEKLNDELADLDSDFEEIIYFLSCKIPETGNFFFDDNCTEILERYLGYDWGEDLGSHFGEEIHPRVYLWGEGFKLAMKQLKRID